MARTNTEIVSRLPDFIVTGRVSSAGAVELACPRETCPSRDGSGGTATFIVDLLTFARPLRSTIKPEIILRGRPCPYCCAVSKIPAALIPKKVRHRQPRRKR